MKSPLFITGIGTNVGKTIVSAILTEALEADYWKPLQTGYEEGRDADTVSDLISNTTTKIHPSYIDLKLPASPNIAADEENVTLELENIAFPKTTNSLLIEGAGGLIVPINNKTTYLDFVKEHQLSVVVVVRDYLGCINHTLLTFEILKKHNIRSAFGVFNGTFSPAVEKTIRAFTNNNWISTNELETLDKSTVLTEAKRIKDELSAD
jgi:dethiobiotin synthetase